VKVGDLVKYRDCHTEVQHFVGVIAAIRSVRSGDRVRVLWSEKTRNWIWDWAEELKVVNEGR
jgi:hypothetical protein